MGKSRDTADGTRYVDASGDTMTGEIDVTTGGYTARGLELPRVGTNIGSAQLGYDGSNGVIRTWASSPIKYQTYGTHQFETAGTKRMEIDGAGRVTTPYQPAFHALKSSHATGSGNIVFDVVNRNIGGCYNNTNGRFTAPVSGTYSFSFNTLLYNMGSASSASLHVNGTASYYGMSALGTYGSFTGTYAGQGGTTVVGLNAGDYVNIYFAHGGTNLHGNYTFWSGHMVG